MKWPERNKIIKIFNIFSTGLDTLLLYCLLIVIAYLLIVFIHNLQISQYIEFDKINDFISLILQVHGGFVGSLLAVVTFFYTFISDYNKSFSSDYLKPFKAPFKKLTNLGLILLGVYVFYLFLTIFNWSNTIISEYIKDIKILFMAVFLVLNFKFWNRLLYLTSLILNHDNRKIWDTQIKKIFLDEFSDTDVNNRLNSLLTEVRKFYYENDINSINLILQAVLNIKKYLTKKFYFQSNIKICKKIISAIIELDSKKLLQYQLINLITNLAELDLLTNRNYSLYYEYFSFEMILEVVDYEIKLENWTSRKDINYIEPFNYDDLFTRYIGDTENQKNLPRLFNHFFANLEDSIKSKNPNSEYNVINCARNISYNFRQNPDEYYYFEIDFYVRILQLSIKHNLAIADNRVTHRFQYYLSGFIYDFRKKLANIEITDLEFNIKNLFIKSLIFNKKSTVPGALANYLNLVVIEKLISAMFKCSKIEYPDEYNRNLYWCLEDIINANREFLSDTNHLTLPNSTEYKYKIDQSFESLFVLINKAIKSELILLREFLNDNHYWTIESRLLVVNQLNNTIQKLMSILVHKKSKVFTELAKNQKLAKAIKSSFSTQG